MSNNEQEHLSAASATMQLLVEKGRTYHHKGAIYFKAAEDDITSDFVLARSPQKPLAINILEILYRALVTKKKKKNLTEPEIAILTGRESAWLTRGSLVLDTLAEVGLVNREAEAPVTFNKRFFSLSNLGIGVLTDHRQRVLKQLEEDAILRAREEEEKEAKREKEEERTKE